MAIETSETPNNSISNAISDSINIRLALPQATEEDAVVARALCWLASHQQEQPSLETLAFELGEKPFSLQKRFSRWAGISPKVFLSLLNSVVARSLLQRGASVLDTTYSVGLSAPSRLHDLFLRIEAMTPGEYKLAGEGLEIAYACHRTPFGMGYFAASRRGLCALGFQGARFPDLSSAKQDFQARWPRAKLREDAKLTAPYARAIFPTSPQAKGKEIAKEGAKERAKERASEPSSSPLTLHLIATPFRLHVWQALLRTPPGALISYASLTRDPRKARAVGQAVAHNPISLLIPCHRVIRQSGALGNYYWGVDKRLAMLGCEVAENVKSLVA